MCGSKKGPQTEKAQAQLRAQAQRLTGSEPQRFTDRLCRHAPYTLANGIQGKIFVSHQRN